MPPKEAQLQALQELFERYRALPRHHEDAAFLRRLRALQQWEVVDMRRRHAPFSATQTEYEKVLEFYLGQLHNGLPLDEMIDRGPKGLEHARRMDKTFPLFASAIEFSVLSADIQDRLVTALSEAPLTATEYAAAVWACDDAALRHRRLDLLVEIGHLIAPHIRSRMIYSGFILLKGMFRNVGLGEIHDTLNTGFRQLRDVARIAQIMAAIAEHEKKQIGERLLQSA